MHVFTKIGELSQVLGLLKIRVFHLFSLFFTFFRHVILRSSIRLSIFRIWHSFETPEKTRFWVFEGFGPVFQICHFWPEAHFVTLTFRENYCHFDRFFIFGISEKQ